MSTKPLKLTDSDKTHMLNHQEQLLKEIYRNAERSLLKDGGREEFKVRVQFKPSKDWITQFADIGFYFFTVLPIESPVIEYDVKYEGVEARPWITADGIPMEWEPKNGEEIECKISAKVWVKGIYIGLDGEMHVVRIPDESEPMYCNTARQAIRQMPRKVKVTLLDLFETYAQAKCIPRNTVELIENP